MLLRDTFGGINNVRLAAFLASMKGLAARGKNVGELRLCDLMLAEDSDYFGYILGAQVGTLEGEKQDRGSRNFVKVRTPTRTCLNLLTPTSPYFSTSYSRRDGSPSTRTTRTQHTSSSRARLPL